jgi:hypothetical protein
MRQAIHGETVNFVYCCFSVDSPDEWTRLVSLIRDGLAAEWATAQLKEGWTVKGHTAPTLHEAVAKARGESE